MVRAEQIAAAITLPQMPAKARPGVEPPEADAGERCPPYPPNESAHQPTEQASSESSPSCSSILIVVRPFRG
jgi:hypothetical protein